MFLTLRNILFLLWYMTLKEKILIALRNPNFPDLKFLYSKEVLDVAEELLEELLEEEKQDFRNKLEIDDNDINFELFQEFSLLDYFFSLLEHYQGVNNNDGIRRIIESFEPKYIDFWNEIAYSKRYYEMLQYCYENILTQNLTPALSSQEREQIQQQERVLEKSIESYEVRGIALAEDKQSRLKEISKELSELSQKFSNNVLDSQKLFEYIITDENILSEMPEDDRVAAKKRAQDKKVKWYLFDASQWAYIAIMKYSSDSSIRKDFYEARNKFWSEGKHNNRPIILQLLKLREEKSQLLGFKNYWELSLKFKMAESPEQVVELFTDIAQKAKPKAEAELQEIKKHFWLSDISVWDLSYYGRKLREEKYALDDRELKKYFVYEKVLEWMFDIIRKLYGVEMKKIDIPSYHDEVELYEVYKDGKFLSYFFTDYFYRPLKRQGAWANILRERYENNKKITLNVCNFQKGEDGKTLLTLWDVETMFHEFWHATHEMLSRSKYWELSGFHVEWDFVELPSQLLENWCRDRVGMKLFAAHVDTGASIPEDMLAKLELLDTFGNGQMILKQNEYAMMDMWLHMWNIPKTEEELDVRIYENYEINALFPKGDIYSPHTSFSHIFDGGYAAWYYSYMWAEIIEKEVWKAFKDSGNIFDKKIAEKFHNLILSAGTTKKASELFRDFFGRDVEIDAFLSEKGLV